MPPTTPTSVVNMALTFIGADLLQSTIDDTTSEQARKAKAVWDTAFGLVVESHEWTFAKKTVELTKSAVDPVNTDEWEYKYTMPSDFGRMVLDSPISFGPTIPYVVAGGFLYTNYDNSTNSLYLTYIRNLSDSEVSLFNNKAVLSLAYLIASFLAARLSKATREEMMKNHIFYLDEAKGVDAMSAGRNEDEDHSDDWTVVGRGTVTYSETEDE